MWKTKAVVTAGPVLAKAGDRSYSKDQLMQLVTSNGRRHEPTLKALISWTFLLRVPSERLPLYRQRAGEDLIADDSLGRKASTGLPGGKLIIKLNKRRHVPDCEKYAPEST